MRYPEHPSPSIDVSYWFRSGAVYIQKNARECATVSVTYTLENISYTKYQGNKSKVLVIFTEQKNMEMQNGKLFSTGNHPLEALLPMLHLKNAGFDFDIADNVMISPI